uniref:Gustatory receptor n=1 Tax=Anopheles farauti TaxID=69004 RepID=A0A182QC79_9DIPT
MAQLELPAMILYVKLVLLGVVPFRLRVSTLELDVSPVLLYYCFAVAIAGPTVRIAYYISLYFFDYNEFSVMFITAIIMEMSDFVLLLIPPCYLLLNRAKVQRLFALLLKVQNSPFVRKSFPLRLWFRQCITFSLVYECCYTAIVLYNMFATGGMGNIRNEIMTPWLLLSILTKASVLLVMYGCFQYTKIAMTKFNALLKADSVTNDVPSDDKSLQKLYTGPNGLMELYEHLWSASKAMNDLFGVPLVSYLFMVFIHTTVIYYVLISKVVSLLASANTSFLVVLVLHFLWAKMDLIWLMKIVSTCGQIRDELSTLVACLLGYLTLIYDRKQKELRVSMVLVVYSALLAVGCIATYQSTQFLMSDLRYRQGFKTTSVNKMISAIQGQVVMQTVLSSALSRYQKRNEIAALMREILRLKEELFNATELNQRWMKLRILRKVSISQLIVASSFVTATVQIFQSGDDDVSDEMFLLCVFYYPKMTIVCSVSLYYAVMLFLQNLHYALNERMKQLLAEHSKGPIDGTRGYVRTQHSVYIRSKLNYLADARYRIVQCCNKTHELYQRMVLSCNFLCITFIVSQLYHFFEILYVHYQTKGGLSVAALGHEALTCLLCYFEVYCIVEACEMVRQQIEVFALQTMHQPIVFTACHMFTLDYTVLFSIAASVTNYLIILIQFEMAIEQ